MEESVALLTAFDKLVLQELSLFRVWSAKGDKEANAMAHMCVACL